MNSGIYAIISPSGKKYIGSSSNLSKRWYQHKYLLNRGDHHNRHLINAWNKYEGNLKFVILLICSPEHCLLYEQIYLDYYKPEYNIAKSSDKAFYALGVKRTQETREKISKSLIGKNTKGRLQSEESKQKLSKSLKGNKNGVGNKANLGRKLPREVCMKIRIARLGCKMSEKQKAFLSESRKGSNNPMFGKIPWNKGKKKIG